MIQRRFTRYGVMLGIVFSSSVHGILQDALGLEGYIQFVRNHWVTMHWGFWFVISCAVFIGCNILEAIEKDLDEALLPR